MALSVTMRIANKIKKESSSANANLLLVIASFAQTQHSREDTTLRPAIPIGVRLCANQIVGIESRQSFLWVSNDHTSFFEKWLDTGQVSTCFFSCNAKNNEPIKQENHVGHLLFVVIPPVNGALSSKPLPNEASSGQALHQNRLLQLQFARALYAYRPGCR